MPNQTIYIRDEDEAMFARARELGEGKISAVITEALRRHLDNVDAQAAGYEEVLLEPEWYHVDGQGDEGKGRPVRFAGRVLAEYNTHHRDARAWVKGIIYVTRAGKIIVWHKQDSCWQGARVSWTVHVYPNLDAVPTNYEEAGEDGPCVPEGAVTDAREALGEESALVIE